MDEHKKQFYLISDAAKLLHVETHVLRYWEDELSLQIPRNNMGHRIYTEKQIDQFRKILQYKEEGYSLKEISAKITSDSNISYFPQTRKESQVIPYPSQESQNHSLDKLEQFRQILHKIMAEAFEEKAEFLSQTISKDVSVQINKEMNYLIREKESLDEERYIKLDQTIRAIQKARQEAAATEQEQENKRLSRKEKRRLKKMRERK